MNIISIVLFWIWNPFDVIILVIKENCRFVSPSKRHPVFIKNETLKLKEYWLILTAYQPSSINRLVNSVHCTIIFMVFVAVSWEYYLHTILLNTNNF